MDGVCFRDVVGIDTETTGLGRKARLISVQAHDGATAVVLDARRCDPSVLLQRLRGRKWVFQNGKYDLWYLMPYLDSITDGEPWTAWGAIWDTMLAEQVINGGLDRSADLPTLVYKYARVRMDKSEQTSFVQRDGESDEDYEHRLARPFTESQLNYMVEDVRLLPVIERAQRDALERQRLTRVAQLEMDLMPVLADMERVGARVNAPGIEALIGEFSRELDIAERKIIDALTPHVLEWRAARFEASEARIRAFDRMAQSVKAEIEARAAATPYPDQRSRRDAINAEVRAWREVNKRPVRIKYDEGPINPSRQPQVLAALSHMGVELKNTRSATLQIIRDMADDDTVAEVIDYLLEFRQIDKLKGSTLEPILELRDERDRLHPNIHQMVRTGRMAMSNPNLQNIPVRSERGKRIRQLFIPDDGNVLVSADFSQIELRVLAEDILNKTGDRTMLDMFLRGEDVHTATASQMYGVPMDQVSPAMRRDAKTINFGLVYGMTDAGLARDLRCTKAEAAAKKRRHFEIHKGVPGWMDAVKREARARGYAQTMLGRRRYFPEPEGEMTYWEEKAYHESVDRQAMNTPIQGTAADIMKIGLIENWKQIRSIGWQINVVHDEVVEECPTEYGQEVAEITNAALVGAGQAVLNRCPVLVEVEVGATWS